MALIAPLAVDCDDPGVWPLLRKAARQCAPGLRMDLLTGFADPKEKRHRMERVRLLASFLNDAQLPVVDARDPFRGLGAGFQDDRIEVRNFAALEVAYLLEIQVEIKPNRTAEEWAGIRKLVSDALQREHIEPADDGEALEEDAEVQDPQPVGGAARPFWSLAAMDDIILTAAIALCTLLFCVALCAPRKATRNVKAPGTEESDGNAA